MRRSEILRLAVAAESHFEKAREMLRRIQDAGNDGDERAARVWDALWDNLDWASTNIPGIAEEAMRETP